MERPLKTQNERAQKFVLLAMNGAFSAAVLETLAAGGALPLAVALPHPGGRHAQPPLRRVDAPFLGTSPAGRKPWFDLPAWSGEPTAGPDPVGSPTSTLAPPETRFAQPPPAFDSTLELAARLNLPIFEVNDPAAPQAYEWLESLAPQALLTACFPFLLPEAWLNFAPLGSLNLHPSLLPAYRGPVPLFWQFRLGETHTGVTLHIMESTADTGDIVTQQAVVLPDGIQASGAERLLGQAGGRLASEYLRAPAESRRTEQSSLPPPEGPAYYPFPKGTDRVLDSGWPARRAFNFLVGAQAWGPFEIQAPGQTLLVSGAAAWRPGVVLGEPLLPEGDLIWVQFAGGAVAVSPYRGIC